MNNGSAEWSVALDALRFSVTGHGAPCAVHRLAFKALLGASPDSEACLACFTEHQAAFEAAARDKIKRQNLAMDKSLHLNSRDIRRALGNDIAPGPQRVCRVLDRDFTS
ncbi:DUF1488 family protein [Agrobacterium sp. AGB01]|uniref:DUF1488 family protein n=1 Tax=Agrobacterium sp. AGB01 TaxID=2769302 RepID=UPI00177D435F|nr:DUF1488 family protein [Agrobacterium sp. AGB01]